MSMEMPGVPLMKRGQDCECDVALICWPAHAIMSFEAAHPLAASAIKVAFCNGAWAIEDGADRAGICYVRVSVLGERSPPGRKSWRVGDKEVWERLRDAGLGVILSRNDHREHVWAKALYVLPLALSCSDLRVPAREVLRTSTYKKWYEIVYRAAERDAGGIHTHVARVQYLCQRLPAQWYPSPSAEELEYFRDKLAGV